MLLAQEDGLESNRDIRLVVVARLDAHPIAVLGDILDGLGHDIDVLLGILLLEAHALDLLDEEPRRTVQDRHLRCIDVDDAVIHAHGVEGAQRVLDGGNFPFSVLQNGAALGSRDVVRQRLIAGLLGQIDAAQTDTCVCRGGVKRRRDMQTCVQADRTEGETLLDSMLLHEISCFLFRIV